MEKEINVNLSNTSAMYQSVSQYSNAFSFYHMATEILYLLII